MVVKEDVENEEDLLIHHILFHHYLYQDNADGEFNCLWL